MLTSPRSILCRPVPAVVLCLSMVLAAWAARPAEATAPEHRLADEFARQALLTINEDPVTTRSLAGSIALIRQAVTLQPDHADHWRLALEIARYAEDDDLEVEAVQALSRLEPDDDVILLTRLNHRLDRLATVDERLERYRALLSGDRRDDLGPAVTSRLLMDEAILLRRQGEYEQFADRLAESVAVDPSNRAAVAMAAGYFQSQVEDPFAEAELYVSMVLADPTDWTWQIALAETLLHHGAYRGASRIYTLAYSNRRAAEGTVQTGMLADYAIAQWAAGRTGAARRTVREYQRAINEQHQMQIRRDQPDMPLAELGRMTAPIDPVVATVRAAIENRDGEQEAAGRALARAVEAYHRAIERRVEEAEENDEVDTTAADRLRYELAWVAAWLGEEPDPARDAFEQADTHRPFSDDARQRFEGWFALKADEPQRARELFEPLADEHITARLGLAKANLMLGERRGAARSFLAVVREQPGTLMGVWAADHLAELLGERVPVSGLARELESLIDDIPRSVERYPTEPNFAVRLRVTPETDPVAPFDPPIVNIEITNNTPYPLAIDPDGPIRPQVALFLQVRTTAAPMIDELDPKIIDIGRRLRLDPREQLTIPVDLRRSALGSLLRNAPLSGANVTVRAVSNFRVTDRGVIRPFLLGSESRSRSFRIDGQRIDEPWINNSLADLTALDERDDLVTMVMLGHFVARVMQSEPGDDRRQRAEDVVDTVLDAFGELSAPARAWLVANMPVLAHFEPMLDAARRSDDPRMRMMYLVTQVREPDDPMLDAGRRSDDPAVVTIAEMMAERTQIRRRQEEMRRQQGR